jgi:hypothetical protein
MATQEQGVFADYLREAAAELTGKELDFVEFVIRRERSKQFGSSDDLPGQFANEAIARTKQSTS